MSIELKESLIKLSISLIIGIVIGGEREYRNKAAGIRTITLICVGSTLFTIISAALASSQEYTRIASNIVTGIGFLGAGAILRDGINVSGLTTASTIWVVAALGMAVGAGEYGIAIAGSVIILMVLTLFERVQELFAKFRKTIELYLALEARPSIIQSVEKRMRILSLDFKRKKEYRKDASMIFYYEVSGNQNDIKELIQYLMNNSGVKEFQY